MPDAVAGGCAECSRRRRAPFIWLHIVCASAVIWAPVSPGGVGISTRESGGPPSELLRFAEMGRLYSRAGAQVGGDAVDSDGKDTWKGPPPSKIVGVQVPAGGDTGNVYQRAPPVIPACPIAHTATCNNKGECNANTGKCMCYSGWAGFDCSLDPLSFFSFDIDCDEMTEEYVTWCLAQTSLGSCLPYQLSWDSLCYRMCEALQGVVCTTWTRRHYCAHTPDCPALCNNFLETYCLPKDPRSEPPYGDGGAANGTKASGEESGAGSGGETSKATRLVQKSGQMYQRKSGTKKGGSSVSKAGLGKGLKAGAEVAVAASEALDKSLAQQKAGGEAQKGGHHSKGGEMRAKGGNTVARLEWQKKVKDEDKAKTGEKGGHGQQSKKQGWGGSGTYRTSKKQKKGEAPSKAYAIKKCDGDDASPQTSVGTVIYDKIGCGQAGKGNGDAGGHAGKGSGAAVGHKDAAKGKGKSAGHAEEVLFFKERR